MKSLEQLIFPDEFRYATDHEWARWDGDMVRVGLSDYAQDQLGEIVYVELPQVGTVMAKDEVFGVVESVKAVSDLYMPVGGEVVKINEALENAPNLVNRSSYEEGWMIQVKPDDPSQFEVLMTRDAYLEMLKKETE
jgi:glycine cleavage system H protein